MASKVVRGGDQPVFRVHFDEWEYSDSNPGGTMRRRILHPMCPVMFLVTCVVVLMTAAYSQQAQQSHWATPDDKSARFMIDMERKWAEGACTNNGVISELLADDFQGTSTGGERYTKADEQRDEKGPHLAHD